MAKIIGVICWGILGLWAAGILYFIVVSIIGVFTNKTECYEWMRQEGSAIDGKCPGMYGGDRFTDYLSYCCVGCPYLDLNFDKEKKKDE